MWVCHCHALTDSHIVDQITDGAQCLDELADRCGAGSSCGTCTPTVSRLLEQWTSAADELAAS